MPAHNAPIQTSVTRTTLNITFDRPANKNAITASLVQACQEALNASAHEPCTMVVWRGNADYFCSGADFDEEKSASEPSSDAVDADALYSLWQQITTDARVHIAIVQGSATGGGIGFLSACDIVIAKPTATFSLPELLFGLFPACVMPFLARRIGWQASHYLTLTTRPISGQQAHAIGLADECDEDVEGALRKLTLRLRNLEGSAIGRYKRYANQVQQEIVSLKPMAVAANRTMFADPRIRHNLKLFQETGHFPWELRDTQGSTKS